MDIKNSLGLQQPYIPSSENLLRPSEVGCCEGRAARTSATPKRAGWALDDDELAAACALHLGAVLDEPPPCEAALNDLRSLPVSIFASARKKRRQTSACRQIKKSDGP